MVRLYVSEIAGGREEEEEEEEDMEGDGDGDAAEFIDVSEGVLSDDVDDKEVPLSDLSL